MSEFAYRETTVDLDTHLDHLSTPYSALVKQALTDAGNSISRIDTDLLGLPGMSGRRYRMFINNLVASMKDCRYLEVGTWAGSTLCSAINNNDVRAVAIDNWSQFGGPKDVFFENLQRFKTPRAYVNFIENDFRQVDFESLGKFNVYLFDGPHEREDQYDGLYLAGPALEECFILIVDDWNWPPVRTGTEEAIHRCGLDYKLKVEIRTTLDDTHPSIAHEHSDWHNGYLIAVLTRR